MRPTLTVENEKEPLNGTARHFSRAAFLRPESLSSHASRRSMKDASATLSFAIYIRIPEEGLPAQRDDRRVSQRRPRKSRSRALLCFSTLAIRISRTPVYIALLLLAIMAIGG